jgi:hypothetical protein
MTTKKKGPIAKAKQRPAETTTIVAGIVGVATLVGFNLTAEQATAIVAVLAAVPAVITFFHARST